MMLLSYLQKIIQLLGIDKTCKILIPFFFFLCISLAAQNIEVVSVSPLQDIIGSERETAISVIVNTSISSLEYNQQTLFQIYGSNSGLIKGSVTIDEQTNTFTYTPNKPFFAGEIVDACFGPVYSQDGDTLSAFHWRFTIGIANPTNAKFDSLAQFDYPSAPAITVDIDEDGDIDIMNSDGYIFYNNGNGELVDWNRITNVTGIKYFIDINNDGICDLLTSYSNDVETYLGDANNEYSFLQHLYPYEQEGGTIIAVGDINGDGFLDLIARESYTEYDYSWRKFTNDGTGTFIRSNEDFKLVNRITEGELVDMNKDGALDLVLLNSPPRAWGDFEGMYIFYNNGKGEFLEYTRKEFELLPYDGYKLSDLRQLFVIDYDNNGLNDLAAFGSVGGGSILLQEEPGVFHGYANANEFSGAENFAYFTSGDVNGDNRFDVIVSGYQLVGAEEVGFEATVNCENTFFNCNSGQGGFFFLGYRNVIGSGVIPVTADIDNDGDIDIIHTGYPTNITYNNNVISSISEVEQIPDDYVLYHNYPNPFNPYTMISYSLPENSNVTLKVYDIMGREIKSLISGNQPAGNHNITWDGTNQNGEHVSSGTYIYRFTALSPKTVKEVFTQSGKMLLIK